MTTLKEPLHASQAGKIPLIGFWRKNRQFAADSECVEDAAVKTVMIEKMLTCLKLLATEEQKLIAELFFKGKSEHQLAAETGIPRMTLHDRKVRILGKLKKLMEK